jgi:hypothetical protein
MTSDWGGGAAFGARRVRVPRFVAKTLSSTARGVRHPGATQTPMPSKTATATPTYMFLFRNPADMPEASPEQMQQNFQKWMTWIQAMKAKGQYVAGEPLEDDPAKVLRGPRGAKVTDGPFAEAKEVVAGYMLIAAKNFAEAVKIAKDCPGYALGGTVEVRQIMPIPV